MQETATQRPFTQRSFLGRLGDGLSVAAVVYGAALVMIVSAPYYGARWLYRGMRWLHRRVGQMKKTLIGLAVVVVGTFAYLYGNHIELSEFAARPLIAIIGCSLYYVVVRYGHNEIDIIAELKGGNRAIATYFLGYAGLIAAALLGL